MSSEVIFVSEVSHAIDLKAEMTSDTNFNCKAVEVAEVNSKKSGRKNHRWRRRIKKTTMSPIIAAIASRLLKRPTGLIFAINFA